MLKLFEYAILNLWGSRLTTDSLQTPLHFAMYSKNLLVVKHLVEKGANINAIDKRQIYPVHVVALAENVEILNYLFEKDPDHFKANSVSVLQRYTYHSEFIFNFMHVLGPLK